MYFESDDDVDVEESKSVGYLMIKVKKHYVSYVLLFILGMISREFIGFPFVDKNLDISITVINLIMPVLICMYISNSSLSGSFAIGYFMQVFAYVNDVGMASYMYSIFMLVFTFFTLFNIPDYVNEKYLWISYVKAMAQFILINISILVGIKVTFYKFILVSLAFVLYDKTLRNKKKMLIGLTDKQNYIYELYLGKINEYAGYCLGYCLLNFIIFVKLVA